MKVLVAMLYIAALIASATAWCNVPGFDDEAWGCLDPLSKIENADKEDYGQVCLKSEEARPCMEKLLVGCPNPPSPSEPMDIWKQVRHMCGLQSWPPPYLEEDALL